MDHTCSCLWILSTSLQITCKFAEELCCGCMRWLTSLPSTLTSTWKRRNEPSLHSFCSPSLPEYFAPQAACLKMASWKPLLLHPPPCFSFISGVLRVLWTSVCAKCQHSAAPSLSVCMRESERTEKMVTPLHPCWGDCLFCAGTSALTSAGMCVCVCYCSQSLHWQCCWIMLISPDDQQNCLSCLIFHGHFCCFLARAGKLIQILSKSQCGPMQNPNCKSCFFDKRKMCDSGVLYWSNVALQRCPGLQKLC